MRTEKIKTYVGFAIKAGKIKFGVDNITATKGKINVILYDNQLSERSKKKILDYATVKNIIIIEFPIEEILPERNCKALGITDINLANAIISEIKEI